MPIIYGEEKSPQEVVDFVRGYLDDIKQRKTSRYNVLMGLAPNGGSRILDYGCGWGVNAIGLRDKGNRVSAIDLSENEIDICKIVWSGEKDVAFAHAPIASFRPEEFDCVFSSQVIEHVHNVGNYVSGIGRVLKPGGQLLISLPNILTPRHLRAILRRQLEPRLYDASRVYHAQYDKTHHHINAWDQFHFVRLMASMGFLMERYVPAEGVPMPKWRLVRPYVHLRGKRVRQMCYTMVFSFTKVEDVAIALED